MQADLLTLILLLTVSVMASWFDDTLTTVGFRIRLQHNFSNINISASIYPPFK
jgi:hypothetical protein